MKTSKLWVGFIILALTLQACNLKLVDAGSDPSAPGYELTVTANAALIETALASGAQPPEAQGLSATEDPALPPTEELVIPAAVLPPATGDVTVTVSVATNCRQGPGAAFKSIYGMPVGQVAKVVAKNSYSGYWIIEIPGQAGQNCWLWGQYAVINGDTSKLKEVVTPTSPAPTITNTPKPTATATATTGVVYPNAPSGLTANISCGAGPGATQTTVNGNLSWTDNSTNELVVVSGVNNVSSHTLAANSTSDSFSVVMETVTVQNASPNFQFTVSVYACSGNTEGTCGLPATIQVVGAGCP